jgi:enoyl-CoA hydratase/carnithine racemase
VWKDDASVFRGLDPDAHGVPREPLITVDLDLAAGWPSFGCGGDLDEFGMATDLAAAFVVRLDRGPWRLLHRLRERTHAHLHGACIGADLEMAAFAGSVTAAADTRLQLPEVSMGLVPGAGGTVSVVRRIGRWRAAWMMITGAQVPVATALRWGLIDAVEER